MTTALAPTRFTVDPWDPGYGMAVAVEAMAEMDATNTSLDLDVEVARDEWAPIDPAQGTTPRTILVADGVRRIDARLWVESPDAIVPAPGIAASYAAGMVRCSVDGRTAATLETAFVSRSHFSASEQAADLQTSAGVYVANTADGTDLVKLSLALQKKLSRLEADLVEQHHTGCDLFLLDGSLRGRSHLRHAVGYVKTHHKSYLPTRQAAVVSALRPGQRTPVFHLDTSWRRYSWYVKLPARSGAPWAGVARCEAGVEFPTGEVIGLADEVARALPSLAGVDYKDPRAPQNLVPIGGLERALRHRLGDARILYRALTQAASDRRSESGN